MTKRKLAILREATRLFAEKGYDATPVSEIARAAGVSEGAIFRHFDNKEDLLFQLFKGIRESFLSELETEFRFSSNEQGLEMALRLVRLYCHFYETMETEFDFIHRNNPYQMPHVGDPCRGEMKKIYDKMIELLRIAITLGTKDHSIRTVSVEESTMLILGLITGAVRMRLFESIHLKEIEEHLVDFCRAALQPSVPCQ
ncbi:MAG: TetR/AcrR family transcriptional regulator [Desulforhabdus sp.]|jgi:TetR/AcrR family fatty acid metabolism transcriptional regulator|nr:TetR/AcrR family transcriptional regulator [Desulforhabdus sp.]